MVAIGENKERLDGLCERDRLNAKAFSRWTLAWAASLVISGLILGPSDTGMTNISLFHYSLASLPLIATFFMVKTYMHFVSHADELIRLLLLNAAASGFGVVFVLGIIFIMTSQLYGDWEDSGAIMWLAGFLTFEFRFIRQWKRLNAE